MNEVPRQPDWYDIDDDQDLNPLILGLASMLALKIISRAKASADRCVVGVALAAPFAVVLSEHALRQS
jgi:hypothetical protein